MSLSLSFLLDALFAVGVLASDVTDAWADTGSRVASAPTVIVKAVRIRNMAPADIHVGKVEAVERVDLVARVEGFLEQRNFVEGGRVSKGDVVFVIEKAPYRIVVEQRRAELTAAQATLRYAKADLARKRQLGRTRATSVSSVDQAVVNEATAAAAVDQARALLKKANLDLSYTDVRIPIDGRIDRAAYSVGNLVNPTSGPLATVVMVDPIHVIAQISEKRLLDVRRNNMSRTGEPPVVPTLRLSDGSRYEHAGRFDFFDTEVDPNTDTITVRATFPNPARILVPGQFVRLEIRPRAAQTRLVVPQAAVLKDKVGFHVLAVDENNVVEDRRVTLGEQVETDWVVEGGLAQGQRVIVHGIQKVRPGIPVVPVSEE